jgi:hypothetical protein
MTKIIDIAEEPEPDAPIFDAGRDSKMDIEPDPKPAAASYGRKGRLGLSKINDYRGQSEPRRNRAPQSVLKAKAEARAAVASMLAAWQEGRQLRGKDRMCAHCNKPLPYRMKMTAKYHPSCKTAADRARAASIERDKVFRTMASVAQDRADAAQRLLNYGEVALQMKHSAHRIGRDDVTFFATPGGVIAANDGAPLPPIRVTVYAHPVEPRTVEMRVAGHNYTTRHSDIVELIRTAKLDEPDPNVTPTVASIPRSSWELRETELERRRHGDPDLLTGPERRVTLYMIDDASYLPKLEQSYWDFRFQGDRGDDVEDIRPEEEAKYANQRILFEWVEKRRSKPPYAHPERGLGFLGRDAEDYARSDLRRVDPGPKPPPIEPLFEETR